MDTIVLGSNHHNTLGLVRSLGEAGHNVYLILIKSKCNYVNKSKYVSRCFLIDNIEDVCQVVKNITEICKSKPVMLVAGDGEATYVNAHYKELNEYCYTEGAFNDGDVNVYHDKFRANELFVSENLSVPYTWTINDKNDIPEDVRFPALMKASDSIRGGKGVLRKCENREELEYELSRCDDSVFPLQLQEYLTKECEIIILGCSVYHGEKIFCPVAEKKIRFYPREYQMTAYTESFLVNSDEELTIIIEDIKQKIKGIGYEGLFSVELIRANGKYYFLETNFRNDGTGYLATVCGWNFPDVFCRSFVEPIEQITVDVNKYQPCHYVNVICDGLNGLHRRMSVVQWIKQWRNAKCYSHYSKKDRAPLFFALLALFKSVLKK